MQQVRLGALVALLYLATAFLSRSLAQAAIETLPVWLASGVTFSALLICARWAWPAILTGAIVAATCWGVMAHDLGWLEPLPFGAIEGISMAVGAWIATSARRDPARPAGTALLIAGALIGPALGALMAVQLWSWARPTADLWAEWKAWTFSTAVGLLLVAPVALAFRGFRVRRSGGMPMSTFVAGSLAFGAFVVVALVVFGNNVAQQFGSVASTLAYAPMPFLLIAALLWGTRGGSLATLAGSLLIIWRTAQGGGPFAIDEPVAGMAVVEVQGFVAAWAVVLLLTRALSEDRRAAFEQARNWRLRYERTMLAVGVASVEYDAVTGGATWGEGAALVFGPAVANIGSVDEWLDRVDSAERPLVQANWLAIARGDVAQSEQDYAVHLGGAEPSRVNEQLASVRGADGAVEQVVALLKLAPLEAA